MTSFGRWRPDGLPPMPSPADLAAAPSFLFVPPDWMDDALCAETDPEAFFPKKGAPAREARAVCANCTVAAECLDFALTHGERFGIWGGVPERRRRKLAHLDTEESA